MSLLLNKSILFMCFLMMVVATTRLSAAPALSNEANANATITTTETSTAVTVNPDERVEDDSATYYGLTFLFLIVLPFMVVINSICLCYVCRRLKAMPVHHHVLPHNNDHHTVQSLLHNILHHVTSLKHNNNSHHHNQDHIDYRKLKDDFDQL